MAAVKGEAANCAWADDELAQLKDEFSGIFGDRTVVVTGADGEECLFDYANETGTGYMQFSCRVPRSLGRVVVYQFDKGVSDIHGYRYGHQYSWDLGAQCSLAGCSGGTVFPADCSGR